MDFDAVMSAAYQIPGWLWPIEQGWLAKAFPCSLHHVEIGVFCGRSLWCSCASMPVGASVVAVDDFSGCAMGADWQRAVLDATIARMPQSVTVIDSKSIDAARQYDGPPLDSVFIDGCHEYAECKADIEAWTHHIRPGGLLCGHDYWPVDSGVMDAVNETGPFVVVPETRIWTRHV